MKKVTLKKKNKIKQKQNKQTNNVIVYDEFYTQKYVFKITYQIPSHVKIGPFFYLNLEFEYRKEKIKSEYITF